MRCMDYVYLPPPRDFVWVNVIMLGCSAAQYDMMLIVPYASSTRVITVVFFRSACTVQYFFCETGH